jgi:hypothetical protein
MRVPHSRVGSAYTTETLVAAWGLWANALLTTLILWAGFTAARFVTHDQFDKRPWQLTVLNCTHELVTLMVMALIIGAWPA